MKNYYYILGISKDASEMDIKKAYRKLSLKFHPDKNDGDKFFEERFKEINEAYENLIDTNRRRMHDSILSGSNFKSPQNNTSNQTNKEQQQRKQESRRQKKKQFIKSKWIYKQFSTTKIFLIIAFLMFGFILIEIKDDLSQTSSQLVLSDVFIKDYDGNVYDIITFGELTWTKKNLDVTHFKNGDTILQAKNKEEWNEAGKSKTPAWRYLDYNPKNGSIGKIYNGYAIIDYRGLAPDGYRIPSRADWENLIKYMSDSFSESTENKTKYGWKDFSALFAEFPNCISNCAIFWSLSKSEFQDCLISVTMNSSSYSNPIYLDRHMGTPIGEGLSVRCVR